jgi:hypothetical protein
VRLESRLLAVLGLEPVLLLVFVLTELILEVDGVGLAPRFSDLGEGDDLTLRHKFFAESLTRSPKSTGSFLIVSLALC